MVIGGYHRSKQILRTRRIDQMSTLFRITWFFYRHWEHGGEDLLPGAGDGAAGVGGGPAILIHPVFQMDGRQAVSILQNCGFYSLLFYSTDLEMRRVRKPEQAAILCEYPATLFMRVGSGRARTRAKRPDDRRAAKFASWLIGKPFPS
jgi:hypothetical protein